MRPKHITLGVFLAAVALVAVGSAAIIVFSYRPDLDVIGYLVGPFLVVFAPWLIVGSSLYIFFPNRPESSSAAKTKSKADPLDL